MRLFGIGGESEDEKALRERQEASQQSIAAGGLPLNAIERLQEQALRQSTREHIFSSDLSVAELLLTRECGFEPLGQVMGSAVFNLGLQWMPGISGELNVLTEAQMQARTRAMDRMRAEAKMLRADGVVGVRIERRESEIMAQTTEFIAVGTAVRRLGAPPTEGEPFLSSVSGQDHWRLRESGYAPVGFAFGTCIYYQSPDWRNNTFAGAFQNRELTYLNRGFYAARDLAMDRLSHDAYRLVGDGVVGVTVETSSYVYSASDNQSTAQTGGIVVHFTAFGTAVRRDWSAPSELSIQPILPLR